MANDSIPQWRKCDRIDGLNSLGIRFAHGSNWRCHPNRFTATTRIGVNCRSKNPKISRRDRFFLPIAGRCGASSLGTKNRLSLGTARKITDYGY
ncbi:unknown protein [Microcystis aeruginosa NIES-843]|uniref:Uncharacterized protein n=1 Tax=Microcystis aeruginosa (strain NIES-843 / IAM M-2473) TaxID=449447 RepID=B0JSI2_MICAN|nr:unknown protein [Microcystis aeruginosa NIES-843]